VTHTRTAASLTSARHATWARATTTARARRTSQVSKSCRITVKATAATAVAVAAAPDECQSEGYCTRTMQTMQTGAGNCDRCSFVLPQQFAVHGLSPHHKPVLWLLCCRPRPGVPPLQPWLLQELPGPHLLPGWLGLLAGGA
jgi:hypothetical protein